ncbi:MAG: hypothetical protein U0359_16050 [Byssovorax sp.]
MTRWLEDPTRCRALLIEDGSTGNISPLELWIEEVVAPRSFEVIGAAVGSETGLVLERRILAALYVALYPDDPEVPATLSLAELRDQVSGGLRTDEARSPRLISLDRVNWGEQSFCRSLRHLLGRLRLDQKVIVSLRVEEGGEDPDVATWCDMLGWTAETTSCLRLPAISDGEMLPMERARRCLSACAFGDSSGAQHIASMLDALGAAARPLSLDELSIIVNVGRDVIEPSIHRIPEGTIAITPQRECSFSDPAVARAWVELRGRRPVCRRLLDLGGAAVRGEAEPLIPYVIEHYGSLLFDRTDLTTQMSLVTESWATTWAAHGDLLGFESDVARVWAVAEHALIAAAAGSAAERRAPILAILRCMQVSKSVMSRVPELPNSPPALPREPKAGNIADERAAALAALADDLAEPLRSRARDHAVEALMSGRTSTTEADLLVRLARWYDGDRRDAIVAKAELSYRRDALGSPNNIGLLRVCSLLPAEARKDICDEVVGQMRELPSYDATTLVEILRTASPDIASRLAQALPALPHPDRLRLACALASHLDGDSRRRGVEEIIADMATGSYMLGVGDLRALVPALDVSQMARLARVLRRIEYSDEPVGVCLRALIAQGHSTDAEALAEADLGVMPFDWILALASSASSRCSEFREELARRLRTMDETRLGWTIAANAAELASVLSAELLVGHARRLTGAEERLVACVALVRFVEDKEKVALVAEAIATLRAPEGRDLQDWRDLLSCGAWMSVDDACYLLVRRAHDVDALWGIKDFAPLLVGLAGKEVLGLIAEQIIEVGRWMP